MNWHGPRHIWQQTRWGLTLAALATLAWAGASSRLGDRLRASWNDPFDARGLRVSLSDAERYLGDVDLARVHADLLPDFWLAHQRVASRRAERHAAFDALYREVEGDARLADLVVRFRDEIQRASPDDAVLRELEARWNAYLVEHDAPFTLRTPLDPGLRRYGHIALSYYVVARHDAMIESGTASVVYGRRVDRLDVAEGYYGWSNPLTNEAFVALDPLEVFARSELWPLLGPVGAARDATISRAFAEQLGSELARELDDDAFRTLRATAYARVEQIEVLRAVDARASCAQHRSTTPWTDRRVASSDVRALQARLARVRADCPDIEDEEWMRLRVATLRIDADPTVERAVDALTWLAADAVAVHELQHLDDDAVGLLLDEAAPRMDEHAAYEVSAYLGAIRRANSPLVALLMACRVAHVGPNTLREPVAHALVEVDSSLCGGAPPAALTARASARWEHWFE